MFVQFPSSNPSFINYRDKPSFPLLITVFNRKSTLQRCLDSVASLDHSNCEIVIVDDGSTDGSSLMCADFCHRYSNCTYHYQSNSGSGPAFQKALNLAKGEFIIPLDSDDWISSELLVRAGKMITAHCPDLIQLEFEGVYENGQRFSQCRIENDVVISNKNHPIVFRHAHHLLSTWRSKILRRSIAEKLQVIGIGRGGDNIFIAQFLFLANTIGFLSGPTYFCGVSENSDSRKEVGVAYWRDYLSRWLSVVPWFIDYGLTRMPTIELLNFYYSYRDYLVFSSGNGKTDWYLISSARRFLKRNRRYMIAERKWSASYFRYTMFLMAPRLSAFLVGLRRSQILTF